MSGTPESKVEIVRCPHCGKVVEEIPICDILGRTDTLCQVLRAVMMHERPAECPHCGEPGWASALRHSIAGENAGDLSMGLRFNPHEIPRELFMRRMGEVYDQLNRRHFVTGNVTAVFYVPVARQRALRWPDRPVVLLRGYLPDGTTWVNDGDPWPEDQPPNL